jgi:CubicO group peptidase (beta-lactamase class C family)
MALSGIALACGSPTGDIVPPGDAANYWPDTAWRRASPADVGLDSGMLRRLVDRLRSGAIPGQHSLLIVRDGWLVVDEYFGLQTPDRPHTMQSVTKSVTSLLIGAAIDRGLIRGAGDSVLGFFPADTVANLDDWKRSLTLDDLLTMRTGLAWSENVYEGSPLQTMNQSRGDWVRFVLDWPMGGPPGRTWVYNSGGVIVLGGVLRAVAKENPEVFAREALFDPLGVGPVWWYESPFDGLPHTGGGLNLRPRDMLRLGYLVLRHGRWNGRQVIARSWIDASTRLHVNPGGRLGGRPFGYGYLWWLFPLDGRTVTDDPGGVIITASGAQGQWIFIVPRYDLVVAVTADTPDGSAAPNFLYNDILPAIRR